MTSLGDDRTAAPARRSFLRDTFLAGGAVMAGVPILGCASSPAGPPGSPTPPGSAPAGRPARSSPAAKRVLLAGPIWNVRAPMIMTTFTEKLDFTGKTIHPLATYAVSGLGTIERDYAASCPGATLGEGLAVRGEEVTAAGPDVDAWLRRTGLPRG